MLPKTQRLLQGSRDCRNGCAAVRLQFIVLLWRKQMTSMEAGGVIGRYLTKEQVEAFGAELEALRKRVRADLGERDAIYIRSILRLQKRLEIGGRLALQFNFYNPLIWLGGVGALTTSKMLDLLELGHNVMHGQYDFTGIPEVRGKAYEWKSVSPSDLWRRHHNVFHHRNCNILGKDRDLGFGLIRVVEEQPWHPVHLVSQPVMIFLQAVAFEWSLVTFGLEIEKIREPGWWDAHKEGVKATLRKALRNKGKEYVLLPLLAGPFAPGVLLGNLAANFLSHAWFHMLINCNHLPEGVHTFTEAECENESRAEWYVRQLLGSGNIEGGRLFHLLSGHVSMQIEHHLFPTLPGHRLEEVAPEVRALCAKYGLPYNTGPFLRQYTSALKQIALRAFPNALTGSSPEATEPATVSGLKVRLPAFLREELARRRKKPGTTPVDGRADVIPMRTPQPPAPPATAAAAAPAA
jgi:fatty acid desaturase